MKLIKYGFGGFLVCLIVIFMATRQVPEDPATRQVPEVPEDQKKPEPEVPFDRMTPAQHLAKGKSLMQVEDLSKLSKDLDEATRHFKAIPAKAPEATEAVAFQKQALKALTEQYMRKARRKYANDLEVELSGQGFDVSVISAEDRLGPTLSLANDLFNDESLRLQYVVPLKKRGLCNMGFRRVALGGSGLFSGMHDYSLGCRGGVK
jgi:hypothetical protein